MPYDSLPSRAAANARRGYGSWRTAAYDGRTTGVEDTGVPRLEAKRGHLVAARAVHTVAGARVRPMPGGGTCRSTYQRQAEAGRFRSREPGVGIREPSVGLPRV